MNQGGLLGEMPHSYPGPLRGIVINSYVANTPTRPFPFIEDASMMVLADVLTIRPTVALKRVPVMQPVGENDGSFWIPRPTRRDILKNTPIALLGPVTRTAIT
jgi:hypothetical protein